MLVNLVSDADIRAISFVGKGANRKRFFLFKNGEDGDISPVGHSRLVKAEDWSAVYCVVAEPGWHEDSGIGGPDIEDRWASEEEIRKAAHRFMANGGLVNKMHESLEPYGQLVENAVALDDLTVDGQTISKGSWYIAITPTADGKAAIEKGEFTGVSIEGFARRELVEKADNPDDFAACDKCLLDPKRGTIRKAGGRALPGLDKSPGKSNWVDQAGGLPDLIDRAARHLHSEQGRSISAAIATAVNWAKKGCATGRAFGGKVKVSKAAQARMCKAVAEWEAKKKAAGVKKEKGHPPESADVVEAVLKGSTQADRTVGGVEKKLLKRMAEKVGLTSEEIAEIEKANPTFGEIIGQREFEDMLPEAFSAFREAVTRAFFPPPGEESDPVALISESCDEFKAWALEKLDTVPVKKEDRAEALGVTLEGSTPHIPTVTGEDMGLTDAETKRIEKLETDVAEIKGGQDSIAKGIDELKKAVKPEPEAPTVESVHESVTKLSEGLDGLKADIAKLGEGGSSQPVTPANDGGTEPSAEAVAKAFKSQGVNPALAGVLG